MKLVMEKLNNNLAQLGEEMAKDPSSQDARKIKGLLDDAAKIASEATAKSAGYAPTAKMEEAIKQLRADVDSMTETVRQAQKNGLTVRAGGNIVIPGGRKARLDMLKDGRAFADEDTAKRFGAYAIVHLYRVSGKDVSELPQYTRELAASVAKDADIDPTASGSGAELVGNEFRAEMIRNVEAYGQFFTAMGRVPLTTMGTTNWPKRTGGLTAYPTAIASQITRSGATFETVSLQPVKWATLTGVPGEMFRIPNFLADVGQFLGVEISYAIAVALDGAVINGDGTAAYGGITGIMQSANISSVAAAATHTGLSTVTGTDVSSWLAGLSVAYALPNAKWGMSLSVQRALRNLRDDNGNPLFDRGSNGEPNTIDGYPYTIGPAMTAAGSVGAGSKLAFFGDLRMSHLFGMVRNIEIAQSEHAEFASDMVLVRGVVHVDCQEADTDAIVTAKTAAQ